MDIIRHLYNEVYNLEEWIRGIDINHELLETLKTSDDSEGYKQFLTSTIVAVSQNAKKLPLPVTFTQVSHQREVIIRVIERIRRWEGIGKNVLTFGFGSVNGLWWDKSLHSHMRWNMEIDGVSEKSLWAWLKPHTDDMSDNPNAQISSVPNIEYRYPNSAVNRLHYGYWKKLLSRIGDTVMEYMLEHTSVFMFIPPSCYTQITGKPSYDLLPFRTGVTLSVLPLHKSLIPGKHKTVSQKLAMKSHSKNKRRQKLQSNPTLIFTKVKEKISGQEQNVKIHKSTEFQPYFQKESLEDAQNMVKRGDKRKRDIDECGATNNDLLNDNINKRSDTIDQIELKALGSVPSRKRKCMDDKNISKETYKILRVDELDTALMQRSEYIDGNYESSLQELTQQSKINHYKHLADYISQNNIPMDCYVNTRKVENMKENFDNQQMKRKNRKRSRKQTNVNSMAMDFKPFVFHTYFPRMSMLYSKYLCEKLPKSFTKKFTLQTDNEALNLYKAIFDSNDICQPKDLRFNVRLDDQNDRSENRTGLSDGKHPLKDAGTIPQSMRDVLRVSNDNQPMRDTVTISHNKQPMSSPATDTLANEKTENIMFHRKQYTCVVEDGNDDIRSEQPMNQCISDIVTFAPCSEISTSRPKVINSAIQNNYQNAHSITDNRLATPNSQAYSDKCSVTNKQDHRRFYQENMFKFEHVPGAFLSSLNDKSVEESECYTHSISDLNGSEKLFSSGGSMSENLEQIKPQHDYHSSEISYGKTDDVNDASFELKHENVNTNQKFVGNSDPIIRNSRPVPGNYQSVLRHSESVFGKFERFPRTSGNFDPESFNADSERQADLLVSSFKNNELLLENSNKNLHLPLAPCQPTDSYMPMTAAQNRVWPKSTSEQYVQFSGSSSDDVSTGRSALAFNTTNDNMSSASCVCGLSSGSPNSNEHLTYGEAFISSGKSVVGEINLSDLGHRKSEGQAISSTPLLSYTDTPLDRAIIGQMTATSSMRQSNKNTMDRQIDLELIGDGMKTCEGSWTRNLGKVESINAYENDMDGNLDQKVGSKESDVSSSQKSEILNQSSVDIDFIPEMISILQNFITRQRKCPYRAFLNRHCTELGKMSLTQKGRQKKPYKKKERMLDSMNHKLRGSMKVNVPVFQRRHNRDIKQSVIDLMVRQKKKKPFLSVRTLLSRYVTQRQSFFYITETTQHRNRLFYYRKNKWNILHRKGLADLMKKGMLKPLQEMEAKKLLESGQSLGIASLRFLPKKKSLRSIINMGQEPTVIYKQTLPINRQLVNLLHVLSFIKNENPGLIGSAKFGTDEIYTAWKAFTLKWRSSNRPNLYFVKTDISNCFDTIDQGKLLHIVEEIFSQYETEELVVRKFASIVISGGKLKRTFHRKVQTMPEYTPDFMSYVKDLSSKDNLHNIILIDQVVNQHENTDDLLLQLKSHLFSNIIKIGKQFYLQKQGISQGSILSTILCNLYYGHMEKQMFTFSDDEILLRVVDDFLYVTPCKDRAVSFLNKMAAGDSGYNFCTNIEKMLINFKYWHERFGEIPAIDGNEWFPWCGMLFNMSTLNVSADFSRYAGVYIADTMTFDLAHKAGHAMKNKLIFSLRPKCHSLFLDTQLNHRDVVITNSYKLLLLTAFKFHVYSCRLPYKQRVEDNPAFFMDMIMDLANFFFSQAKYSSRRKADMSFSITKEVVQWLCIHAFTFKLHEHQSQYRTLIKSLKVVQKILDKKLECKENGLSNKLLTLTGQEIPGDFVDIFT